MTYNYDRFRLSDYDLSVFPGAGAGQMAAEFELTNSEGERRRLSDYSGQWLVLETGSVTCPMYARNVSNFSELQQRFPDVNFVLLYVREAHPGGRTGCHTHLDEKVDAAKRVESEYAETREVLVDGLDGATHLTYGGLPNMVYVIDPQGQVIYRNDWTVMADLEAVLNDRPRLQEIEHADAGALGQPPLGVTITVLLKGGWQAVWDFLLAVPFMASAHKKADQHHLGSSDSKEPA